MMGITNSIYLSWNRSTKWNQNAPTNTTGQKGEARLGDYLWEQSVSTEFHLSCSVLIRRVGRQDVQVEAVRMPGECTHIAILITTWDLFEAWSKDGPMK